jgi:hypothetical protein
MADILLFCAEIEDKLEACRNEIQMLLRPLGWKNMLSEMIQGLSWRLAAANISKWGILSSVNYLLHVRSWRSRGSRPKGAPKGDNSDWLLLSSKAVARWWTYACSGRTYFSRDEEAMFEFLGVQASLYRPWCKWCGTSMSQTSFRRFSSCSLWCNIWIFD